MTTAKAARRFEAPGQVGTDGLFWRHFAGKDERANPVLRQVRRGAPTHSKTEHRFAVPERGDDFAVIEMVVVLGFRVALAASVGGIGIVSHGSIDDLLIDDLKHQEAPRAAEMSRDRFAVFRSDRDFHAFASVFPLGAADRPRPRPRP